MGSKGSSTPQAAASVPQPPSYGAPLSDYAANYYKIYDLEKEYGPKEAELALSLLKEYGPQYDQYLMEQQKSIQPETYALQENLAALSNQGMGAGLPSALKSQYLDNLRSEIGPNAGSGIGGDYVSRNLINLGEQYKQHYQNLGLSLLGRGQNAVSSVPYSNPTSGFGNALSSNAQNYGSYVQGLTNMPYYTNGGKGSNSAAWGGLGAAAGMGLGALFAAPTGGLSLIGGAALGGGIGGSAGVGLGSFF